MNFYRLAAVLLSVLTAQASWAEVREESARPGINDPYENPDFAQWKMRFETSGREVYDRREDIVARSNIRKGMHIADVGSGTGLFTVLFAKAAGPSGKVYAVDISRPFVEAVKQRAERAGLRNVVGVVSTARDAELPPESIDLAFLSDTYHHFEYPRNMLASIRRALRPGGHLIVIDYERIPGKSSPWVMDHVRLGKAEAIQEIEQAGFELVEDVPLLSENYFVRFRKSAQRVSPHNSSRR